MTRRDNQSHKNRGGGAKGEELIVEVGASHDSLRDAMYDGVDEREPGAKHISRVNIGLASRDDSHDVSADEYRNKHNAYIKKVRVYRLSLGSFSLHRRVREADKANEHKGK